MKSPALTILTESDIRKSVGLDADSLAAIENAFAQLAEGKATVPAPMGIEVVDHHGEVDVKSAYLHGADAFAIKIAAGFYNNKELGLPTASGMMVLLSAETGFPKAVLFDNGYLTQLRTALAGAIAAKYFAPQKVDTVAVIGAGLQGRYQLRALRLVRKFTRAFVVSRTAESATKFAAEMSSELGLAITPARSIAEAIQLSDLVITATPSRAPLVLLEHLHAGLHITSMGSDGPGKQELDPQILRHVDRLCCDRKSQSFHSGELQHGLKYGAITEQSEILELGEVTSGRISGRRTDSEISVCDLTGVGIQDTAIALLAYHHALEAGLGTTLQV